MPRPKGVPNKTKQYAITLVPVSDANKTIGNLQLFFHSLITKYKMNLEEVQYEFKKDMTPHAHGHVTCLKSLYIKADDIRGWSLRICPITNIDGWRDYIRKDTKKTDNEKLFNAILKENEDIDLFYKSHYGFEDEGYDYTAMYRDITQGTYTTLDDYKILDDDVETIVQTLI